MCADQGASASDLPPQPCQYQSRIVLCDCETFVFTPMNGLAHYVFVWCFCTVHSVIFDVCLKPFLRGMSV
jgi:hypothetical protein